MKSVLAFAVLASLLSLTLTAPNNARFKTDQKWKDHSNKFGLKFNSDDDETKGFSNFEENDKLIADHNNNPKNGYKLGHNEFSTWSKEELKRLSGLKEASLQSLAKRSVGAYNYLYSGQNHTFRYYYPTAGYALKNSVDWVAAGWNTGIRNQGSCGDCWAFATTGAVEAALWMKNKTNLNITLSPQQLTDCSIPYGNNGCNGGVVAYAYGYINDAGLCQDSYYPFNGKLNNCSFNGGLNKGNLYKVSGYNLVVNNDSALMEALDLFGPLPVGINASKISYYKSGIFANNVGDCLPTINHAVVLTGYGVDSNGTKYWTIKNSWGSGWGNKGYMNISRNIVNNCGIASYVYIPVL